MSKSLLKCYLCSERLYLLRGPLGGPHLLRYSTKPKPIVTPDETVVNSINNSEYKPRKHPGIIRPKTIDLPEQFTLAVTKVTQDHHPKTLRKEAEPFVRYLKARHVPLEQQELKTKAEVIQDRILTKLKAPEEGEEFQKRFTQAVNNRTISALKRQTYNWRPVKYDLHQSLLFLMGRAPAEYAVLYKIMNEIVHRDPNFNPRSLFDFGSGVGTSIWAAVQFWKKSIFEYYNVDISREMNDLSAKLLEEGKVGLKGVFHRQFLPATITMYDLVICSYSLFELPNARTRLETALNLWNRTGKYLIIVDNGTNAGFKLVNELRDFILESSKGHVFSPCPHDRICPRFVLNDGTPCNFEVFHFDYKLVRRQELFSYVVLKKGPREGGPEWPRVVRPTMVKARHSICKTCTADGDLEEVIFTKKRHGIMLHHCARHTDWGDRLPVSVERQGGREGES